ncbi:hypothetical protein ALC57_10639, partial [Trachymyrmex cornetzi]
IDDVLELDLKHVTSCLNAKCNYSVTTLEKTTLEKSCLPILSIQSTLKRKKVNVRVNVLKKKTVFELTLSILVIQLNLYTFVNGTSKKIIDSRYVEIALRDHRGHELSLSLETWKVLYDQR